MTRDIWDSLDAPALFSCSDVWRNVPNTTACEQITPKSNMLQFHTNDLELVYLDPESKYWSDKLIFGELIKPEKDYKTFENKINNVEGCKVLDTHPHKSIDEYHIHFVCHENNATKGNAQMWELIKLS